EITLFTADDIMSANVVSVRPDVTVERTVDLFEQYDVSGLPVVDDENRLLGMITEYDLLHSIRTLELCGTVADFMTRDVITVEQHAPLVDVVNTLLSSRIRRVPVIDDGKLVGVVSRRDLLFAGKIRQQLLTQLPDVEIKAAESSD
ncbi:MAG: CBS domain-containing protein, partial [Thermoguttaceae bacterium]